MSRRGEQLFHLSISVFALSLTLASILAIEYQRSPARVRHWLAPLRHVSLLSGFSGLHSPPSTQSVHQKVPALAQQNGQRTPGAHSQNNNTARNNAVSQPALGPESQASLSKLIRVKAFNSNVPSSQVVHTQNLLKQYDIAAQIASFLGISLRSRATIDLVTTSSDYQQALQAVGVTKAETSKLSLDTGGFTDGSTVIIPLYQNKTTPELVNTLTHELTHVFLNENGGALPSWLNEGMAVHMGMLLQTKTEPNLVYSGYAKRMAENVIAAVISGSLRPLTGDELKVIQGKAPYDLELQDWLAVNMLLQKDGTSPFQKFLRFIHSGQPANSAFSRAFNTSQSNVNTELTRLLRTAAAESDKGVTITLKVPAGYKGSLRILPHGTHNWDGIALHAGMQKLTVLPNGTVLGYSGAVQHTYDSRPSDKHTVYLNLDPQNPFTYQGKKVEDSGFALDYHNGLYGFADSWITLVNGKTAYISKPSLFGVQLEVIRERSQTNPVLTLLQTSQ
ncbi:hypothetical protein [Alicyclobacillus sp. SO9]|uniref:hypothetical protein n=1 Tax=Alicyclobacillus sp. SO9 TaxID=2665646 RepID=UPI0018E823AC|nr:hypothetical protein [Alicyclobacillus sp. SO9]QQE78132.1 hypothetical protein GI364_19945 [Alicyclobacillus sp. SO9]